MIMLYTFSVKNFSVVIQTVFGYEHGCTVALKIVYIEL